MNPDAVSPDHRRNVTPPGFTFLEVLVSVAMLAALLIVTGRITVLLKRQTISANHNALVLGGVDSAMEELTAQRWDAIDDAAIASLEIPATIIERWPEAKFSGGVVAETDPVEAKRILLKLSLTDDASSPNAALTTWIYRKPRN